MPGNDCRIEELALFHATRDFEKAVGEAEDIRWEEISTGIAGAYLATYIAIATSPTVVGAVAGVGAAAASLGLTWRSILKDFSDIPGVAEKAKGVEDAYDALEKCREDHKILGDNPLDEPPSVFEDFPVIPFADPDPDTEVDDDEIIIFDDTQVGFEEEEDIIIIIDEED